MAEKQQKIPIFINNRNRLTSLKALIRWLQTVPVKVDIVIADNKSTYTPLLQYYEDNPDGITVERLGDNIGPYAPWVAGVVAKYTEPGNFYVVSDSDIVPRPECPLEAIPFLVDLLRRFPAFNKAGLSLDIFDLPESFPLKREVVNWELRFWRKRVTQAKLSLPTGVKTVDIYDAEIDTTFAVYHRGVSAPDGAGQRRLELPTGRGKAPAEFIRAVRAGFPLTARHTPWYVDASALDEEEAFVLENNTIATHWTKRIAASKRSA